MKKIICIGGTSRSGSTLLDVILANDPKAMSLGEIQFLFRPTRKHNFEEREKLKGDAIWSQILQGGAKNLYPNLIRLFPDVDIFVDSSKDPFWFSYHEKKKRRDYQIQHVLIYKSPQELAKSFIKRGLKTQWIGFYIFYHRLYMSMIGKFTSISYRDLVSDDLALSKLCTKLGIPFFEGKKNYWEREHSTFFGSNSIRAKSAHNASGQLKDAERKELKYDGSLDAETAGFVKEKIRENPMLEKVYAELRRQDVNAEEIEVSTGLKSFSKQYVFYVGMKMKMHRVYRYFSPLDYFGRK